MMTPNRECGPAAASVELFLRQALVLPRRPAVLVMDATPDQDLCGDGRLRWIHTRNRNFVGACDERRSLMNVYRDFGIHQIAPSSIIPTVTCGDEKFSRVKLFGGEGKDYPKPARWHPNPAGHRLLADMLFMHYAELFLSALDRLEHVVSGATAIQLLEYDTLARSSLRASLGLSASEGNSVAKERHGAANDVSAYRDAGGGFLPHPAWCGRWRFCSGAGGYRCATTFTPLAGGKSSRLLDMAGVVHNQNYTDFLALPTEGRWALTLNEEASPLLAYLRVTPPNEMHIPIDHKWTLIGDKGAGPIDFEFETFGGRFLPPIRRAEENEEEDVTNVGEADTSSGNRTSSNNTAVLQPPTRALAEWIKKPHAATPSRDSRVVVCKPDFIDRVDFADDTSVRFRIDGVEVPAVELVQYGLRPGSCFLLDAEVGVGRHTLTVEPLKDGEPFMALSHLLYPA